MLKLLLPLLSFFLGNAKGLFSNPKETITQQLVLHLRGLSITLSSCVGSLVLFCVGASLLLAKVVEQVDSDNGFYFTTGMWIYVAWTAITFFILLYSLRKDTWLKSMGFRQYKQEQEKKTSGPLENAVALLILDFVESRKGHRENQNSDESPS